MKENHIVYRCQFHYSMYESARHPHEHMLELAKEFGFKLLHAEPVSIADCWIFIIESEDPWVFKKLPNCLTVQGYPCYFTDSIAKYRE